MAGFDPDAYFAKVSEPAPTSSPNGFDPDAYFAKVSEPQSKGVLDYGADALSSIGEPIAALGELGARGLGWVGKQVDRVTGAPTRQFVSNLQTGAPKSQGLLNAVTDPENAPTGRTIARQAGIPNTSLSDVLPSLYSETGEGLPLKKGGLLDPTAAGAAGLAADIGLDWSNIVPISAVGKLTKAEKLAELAKDAAKIGGKGIAEGAAKAVDLATGLEAGTGLLSKANTTAEAAKGFLKKEFNPEPLAESGKLLETAKANGINPENLAMSVNYGKNSSAARAERALREGPEGEQLFKKYTEGKQQIDSALQNKIGEVAGGKVPDQIEAGQQLVDSYEKSLDDMLGNQNITYSQVHKLQPGMQIHPEGWDSLNTKLNGIEKKLKGTIARPVSAAEASQAQQTLNLLDSIRSTNGNLKQNVELMQRIGKAAFTEKPVIGMVGPEKQVLQDIYNSMKDATLKTVDDVAPDLGKQLRGNNAEMSQFFKDSDVLKQKFNGAKNPEQLFKSVVLNGGSKEIEAMKKILPEEVMNQQKAAFIQSLIKQGENGISYKQLRNAMSSKANQIKTLFTPEEIKGIQDIMDLGEAHGDAVLSYSGTGASNSYRDRLSGFGRLKHAGDKIIDTVLDKVDQGTLNRAQQKLADQSGKGLLQNATEEPLKGGLLRPLSRPTKLERFLKRGQSIAPQFYGEDNNGQ